MGREVGGGIGMGKTCEPKAFSFQCMTELTTNKKIIIMIIKKNNKDSVYTEKKNVATVALVILL